MTPLLAGWLSSKNQRVGSIWIAAMGVTLMLSLFTGSRGIAFRSIGMFMFGRIIGVNRKARGREVVRVGILGVVLVIVFGFIGDLRNAIGRIGVDDLSSQRISAV